MADRKCESASGGGAFDHGASLEDVGTGEPCLESIASGPKSCEADVVLGVVIPRKGWESFRLVISPVLRN